MVYAESAEMAAVSRGTSHASAVSTPLRWIFNKTRYKKLVTHVESHASAVSLLKRAENSAIQAIIEPEISTLHSSQPTDSHDNLLLYLLDHHAPATRCKFSTRPCRGSLPWDHAFLRPSKNGAEQKDRGSNQDCKSINRFFVPQTNSLKVSYIRLKFRSVALKF